VLYGGGVDSFSAVNQINLYWFFMILIAAEELSKSTQNIKIMVLLVPFGSTSPALYNATKIIKVLYILFELSALQVSTAQLPSIHIPGTRAWAYAGKYYADDIAFK